MLNSNFVKQLGVPAEDPSLAVVRTIFFHGVVKSSGLFIELKNFA